MGRPKRLIIEAIREFHYLSAKQLALLLFSPGSLSYVRQHLKEMFHGGYVRRIFLPKITPLGSSLAIYSLDKKGISFLRAIDRPPDGRFRSSEQARREELYLEHTLAANDFLILCHRLEKQGRGVAIRAINTEREMKRCPLKVKDVASKKGDKIHVVPDAWVSFLVNNAYEFPLALELDRGTVERDAFRRKIRGLVEVSRRAYQEVFGTDCLTIVFVITVGGQKRLSDVLKWTEEELKSIHAEGSADLFRFAHFIPGSADPYQVFFAPIWLKPLDERATSLLGGQPYVVFRSTQV